MPEQETTAVADAEGQEPQPQDQPQQDEAPEWARNAIAKANKEAASYRAKVRELEPLARKARELEEASKTEQQRLEERAAAAERDRDEARAELTRLRMAARYGIGEDDLDLLGSGTDEEIEARARRLAERLAPHPSAPPVPGRPVEAARLRSAAVDADAPAPDGNDWFRRFVGQH